MYITLAQVYDRLTQDIDYSAMADKVADVFNQYSVSPELVLDLGCGTGSLALALVSRGYDLIGVDVSAEMLEVAARKARDEQKELLLLHQDIRNFELYGTVGAVLATMDVLNHLTDKRDLMKTFRLVHNYLDPEGLFVFDLNSPWKLSSQLPAQTFYQVEDDLVWMWNSTFDSRRSVCAFDLVFFVSDAAGVYQRHDEWQEERAWSVDEVTVLLGRSGFELLSVNDGWSTKKAKPKSERLLFVARRRL